MSESKSRRLSPADGRRLWIRAQRLDSAAPFGSGPGAVVAAVSHLGYVQIDTINVIERSHHHILATRIPGYRPSDLRQAQTVDKTVFEYWTHALSYVPTTDFRYFQSAMRRHRRAPMRWFGPVEAGDLRRVVSLIRREGALSIRDIDDEVLVDKEHPWASRKPSKRALQLAFFNGAVTVSERSGMLKTYELVDRHFGWKRAPRSATDRETAVYWIERALRAQGVTSVDAICHGIRGSKPLVRRALAAMVKERRIVPVRVAGFEKIEHWARPAVLEESISVDPEMVHLLSPFDPLVIQRDRLEAFFGYRHVFEAYLPASQRRFGYFALPVLVGDRIAAAIDLKTDRVAGKLLIQRWNWIGRRRSGEKARIEAALGPFERFQLGG